MTAPAFVANDVFLHCVSVVPDANQQQKYALHQPHMAQGVTDYLTQSQTRSWCVLPRSNRGQPQQMVSGQLSKGELVDLYDKFMVGTNGPSRDVYDALMVAAGGRCPYCAGIGQVATLDHYLPKSYFPLHAINPMNLVPSCRDCNTGKNATFPHNVDGQSIHPYVDDPHFFNERWVFASVSAGDPVTVQFDATPPVHWSAIDRSRAINHFNDNKLPLRYSVQSSGILATVISLRRGYLRPLSPQEFSNQLMDSANTVGLPLNGWERTLYFGLATSAWFCSRAF